MTSRLSSASAGTLIRQFLQVVTLMGASVAASLADSNGYQYYLDGNLTSTSQKTVPGLLLAGGATDQDDAMSRFVASAGYGNVVVMDAYGKDSYGPYIKSLGASSVQTFVFNNRSGAYDPAFLDALRHADAIYFDGGNQWDYVNYWQDTPVEDIINQAALKKPVGGISAGLAILGKYVFTAEQGTIDSQQALTDPYYSHVNLINNFLSLPTMDGIITDTHFVTRDRMGRTVTFLARILKDGWANQASAIAVEQGSTLWVDASGRVKFYGKGGAYFLRTTHAPEVCQKGAPLTFTNIEVYKIDNPAASFDLGKWKGSGGIAYQVSAQSGLLSSTQAGGSIY